MPRSTRRARLVLATLLGLAVTASCAEKAPKQEPAETSRKNTIEKTGRNEPLPLPTGCAKITPANDLLLGWTGRQALRDGYMVWRWVDNSVSPNQDVLMIRELGSGAQRELLRTTYPRTIARPTSAHGSVFFDGKTAANSREIYMVDIGDGSLTRITNDDVSNADVTGSRNGIVYRATPSAKDRGLRYFELDKKEEMKLTSNIIVGAFHFDGLRWVVYHHDHRLHLIDLQNLSRGAERLPIPPGEVFGLAFNKSTRDLVISVQSPGKTDGFDLMMLDMKTRRTKKLVEDPGDQGLADADGNLIAYVDSGAAGTSWFGNHLAEVKIVDTEARHQRTVFPLGMYFGLSIWNRFLAVNSVGPGGDAIVLCNLVEGGFMDSTGKVIPEVEKRATAVGDQ